MRAVEYLAVADPTGEQKGREDGAERRYYPREVTVNRAPGSLSRPWRHPLKDPLFSAVHGLVCFPGDYRVLRTRVPRALLSPPLW